MRKNVRKRTRIQSQINVMETVSETEAAKLLGITPDDVKKLVQQEILHPISFDDDNNYFAAADIAKIKYNKKQTLSEEAELVGIEIQKEIASSVSFVKKALFTAGGGILIYCLLIIVLTLSFAIAPLETARWIGYTPKIETPLSAQSENPDSKGLAAATSSISENQTLMQMILKPASKASFGIMKYTAPKAYEEIGKITIIDVNDVMGIDSENALSPSKPIHFSSSDLLQIADSGLIENLNSQYLQGKKPGTEPGDIAIVGKNQITKPLTLASDIDSLTKRITDLEIKTISGVTNDNLSGDAGITNANLEHSSLTIETTSPLSGGGSVSLGGILTLTCPTCGSGGSSFTATSTDTLKNKTIDTGFNTLSGLSPSNFSISSVSQWTNDSGYITATTSDSLINKTISASLNTISGLTNSDLSGSAGITNANLANASVAINTSTGLSGGATLSLGGNITLTNTGVTSLVGTPNQVITSGSTGALTLSLPQNIAATSSPTFASLNLTNTANQLVLGTTNLGTVSWSPSTTRTLTFPDATDTIVGKTTTDILTNKTLTAPTINGTVTTTGLTLPGFTANGSIVGTGSPTITGFGSINGLTLSAATDGFTLAGGTTSRTLTVTGADITVGSIIKPTAAGTLTIQSNGANQITLDTGGAATLSIGTTSASAITIGRAGTTTTISATASANDLIIGGGATITRHLSATGTFDAPNVTVLSCSDIGTVTVTGAATGDTVLATPTPVGGGIETLTL